MAKRGSAPKPPPAEVDPDLLPPPSAPPGDEDIPPMGADAAPPEPDAPPEPEALAEPDAPPEPEALAEPLEPVRAEDVLEPSGAQDRRRAAEVTPPTGRPARGRGSAATGSTTAPSPAPSAIAPAVAAPKGAARIIQSGSGSYEVLRQLGEGGMAQVFHARRVGAAGFVREVALKRVHTGADLADNLRRGFIDEARLAAKLRHPGIAQVYDLVEEPDGFTLVMEYVEGLSLKEVIVLAAQKGATLERGFACYVTACLAEALHYAHELREDGRALGIVHRDVSPHNAMLATTGEVKLLDFGIAYSTLEGRDKTKTGLVKGKANYMSPEQAEGEEELDGRSDQFSLGIVLVELLTGRRVFEGGNEAKTLSRLWRAEPADVQAVVDSLPLSLQSVCTRALTRPREGRFPSCGDFAQALREWLAAEGLVYGPRQAAEALSRLKGLPDAPKADRPGKAPSERTTPSRGLAAQPPPPPGATAVLTPPARRAEVPAEAEGGSPTEVRRRERLLEAVLRPQGVSRRTLVLPAVLMGVLLLGGLGAVAVFSPGGGPTPAPVLEEVKTPAQERMEQEAAQRALQPSQQPPELAPVYPAAEPSSPSSATPTAEAPRPAAPRPATAPPPASPPALSTSQAVAAPTPSPGETAAATPPEEAAPAPAPRRSLATSMATSFADAPAPASEDGVVQRGTFISACLTTPADGNQSAPFTLTVKAPVKAGGAVAIPQGASLVCTPQGVTGNRLGAECDTLNIPGRGGVAFSGRVYGKDKIPGLIVALAKGPGVAEDARDTALSTAGSLAGQVAPGTVAGELLQGAVGVGGNAARRSGSTAGAVSPVPSGTCALVFVNQSF